MKNVAHILLHRGTASCITRSLDQYLHDNHSALHCELLNSLSIPRHRQRVCIRQTITFFEEDGQVRGISITAISGLQYEQHGLVTDTVAIEVTLG